MSRNPDVIEDAEATEEALKARAADRGCFPSRPASLARQADRTRDYHQVSDTAADSSCFVYFMAEKAEIDRGFAARPAI